MLCRFIKRPNTRRSLPASCAARVTLPLLRRSMSSTYCFSNDARVLARASPNVPSLGSRGEDVSGEVRQVHVGDVPVRGQHDGTMQDVVQLPHVSRPIVGCEPLQRARRERLAGHAEFAGQRRKKMSGQHLNVASALTQWRQLQPQYVKAEEQIRAKGFFRNHALEVLVAGRDDLDAGVDKALGPDRPVGAFLQQAKELGLRRDRQRVDLVKKQRSGAGERNQALLVTKGIREGTAHMAEHLALEQVLGKCCAIDRHKRQVAPFAKVVDGTGTELLAGPGLSGDQRWAVGARDQRKLRQCPHKCRVLADECLRVSAPG